jgi:hypothetical protein
MKTMNLRKYVSKEQKIRFRLTTNINTTVTI